MKSKVSLVSCLVFTLPFFLLSLYQCSTPTSATPSRFLSSPTPTPSHSPCHSHQHPPSPSHSPCHSHQHPPSPSPSPCHSHQHPPSPSQHRNRGLFRIWCHKDPQYEKTCIRVIKSDPRENLKSDPKGLVVILTDAAIANSNAAVLLLKNLLTRAPNERTKDAIKGCLQGYNLTLVSLLKVDMSMKRLRDPDSREEVSDALTEADDEVTYDCGWDLEPPMFPFVTPMVRMVDVFASIVRSAAAMLTLIK